VALTPGMTTAGLEQTLGVLISQSHSANRFDGVRNLLAIARQ
jgi:hypothetical protein